MQSDENSQSRAEQNKIRAVQDLQAIYLVHLVRDAPEFSLEGFCHRFIQGSLLEARTLRQH